jgi:hypothetical protein
MQSIMSSSTECASCGKSEVDDKAQEELKKRDDACEDYSNEIVIENDTHCAAASPPPPQEDHDIVVEAFAVPEEDIVVTAAEQGENQNNGEQQQDDEEAVVQHPPQHSDQSPPSSSDNVPATQRVRKMLSIVGDIFERLLEILPLYFFCNLVILMIMMVIGRRSHPEFHHHSSYPSNICRHRFRTNLRSDDYSDLSQKMARTCTTNI